MTDFNEKLDKILIECSYENWDGYKAEPISEEVIEYSKIFIKNMEGYLEKCDENPAPCCDGDIHFDFGINGNSLTVCVDKSGTVIYVGAFNDNRVKATENNIFVAIEKIKRLLRDNNLK